MAIGDRSDRVLLRKLPGFRKIFPFIMRTRTESDEKMSDFVTKLPRIATRLVFWAVRTLDYFGWLPASFIKGDALYTSVYLANLGSIGLDAVYHHMFE
jgi:hypothetical protein